MALQKTIYTSDNTGVAATYWCACDVDIDFHKKHGSIELMGYINQQAYADGRNPVIVKEYEIRTDLFDLYFSEQVLNQDGVNTRTQAYGYIKDYSGEFSDAEEVL
jgi:hypothetical protein